METVHQELLLKLQDILQQYEEKNCPLPTISVHSKLPDLLIIPSQGPLQWEKCNKEVIVDHLCGCAVMRGADVFAQGILGAPTSMQKGNKVSVYADVANKCLKGFTKTYEGRKVFVGNGIVHISRSELFDGDKKPSGLAIKMTEPVYSAPSLSHLLPACQVFPQNLPSAVAGRVLGAKPGEIVLDMCAAPGGKTTHIATLMKNTGNIIAFDKSQGKVDKIINNCDKLGLTNVKCYAFDGTKALALDPEVVRDPVEGSPPPYSAACFDRVMLDAPCSALGQRPALQIKMTAKELGSYPKLQKHLFSVSVDLLKKGGTLVYSTCTITLAENEELVSWALDKFPCLKLDKQDPHIGGTGWKAENLTQEQSSLLQRFDPSLLTDKDFLGSLTNEQLVNLDTIGFFIAKFVKS